MIARIVSHAVEGFSERYPRSRLEMGLGLSAGLLVALVFRNSHVLVGLGLAFAALTAMLYTYALLIRMKQLGKRGDAAYDERGKYRLSKDYHTSESATAARRRRTK